MCSASSHFWALCEPSLHCRYAAGATIQILLFGILAIEIKRKAPTAHTMLEIIRARWGTLAHIVSTPPVFPCAQSSKHKVPPGSLPQPWQCRQPT